MGGVDTAGAFAPARSVCGGAVGRAPLPSRRRAPLPLGQTRGYGCAVPFSLGPLPIPGVAVLAPMAGMTDLTFRLLCRQQGCALVYTELVNARTLLDGTRRSFQIVECVPAERPVGVQLYGTDPAELAEAARWVAEHVPCDLIDLNMGCPVTKIVSKGAGAFLMRQPDLVERLVSAVVRAVDLPVTAKTRSGWDDGEINAPDVARAIEAGGGAAVAVHARTRAQRHEGPVDWELLAAIKQTVGIPVLGNGGVTDAAHALRMRSETGVDAVMVGRGALGNPWLFGQIEDAWEGRTVKAPSVAERLEVVGVHLRSVAASFGRWARGDKERALVEQRAVSFVRGHLVRYCAGAPQERSFKTRINTFATVDEVLLALAEAWGWRGELPAGAPLPAVTEGSLPLDLRRSGPPKRGRTTGEATLAQRSPEPA
jgi:tRNA-dihydrouridine synthase B